MTVSTSIPSRSSFLPREAVQAWEYFQETGYPNSKNENWRFSNPEAWLQKDAPRFQKNGQNSLQEFSDLILPNTTPVFIDVGQPSEYSGRFITQNTLHQLPAVTMGTFMMHHGTDIHMLLSGGNE